MKKRMMSMTLCLCMALSLAVPAYAAEEAGTVNEPVYAETHYQVNFEDVDINIDGDNIDVELIDKPSLLSEDAPNTTQEDVDLLNQALVENDEMREALLDDFSSDEDIVAISVTEAPLLLVDGHYERVTAEAYQSTYESSNPSYKGKFSLYTTVSRSAVPSSGKYTYTTGTHGSWSENSFLGNSNYPASGWDYVAQTTPKTWVYANNGRTMTARYTDATNGTNGNEFTEQKGAENWTQWAIKDDPVGNRQNKYFSLNCKSYGLSSTKYRQIKSAYVHTWASMSVRVSITLGENSTGITLSPEIVEKSWPLYNSVSFNF